MSDELEDYGDTGIQSKNTPVPRWLLATYLILPIWGIISFCLYWNGSEGWLDRGYWRELQQAANTTFPQIERREPQFEDGASK